MKTKTVKVALYRNIRFDYDLVLSGCKVDIEDCIRISRDVDVEFEIIDDISAEDAIQALKIESVQARIKAAQAELDALL